MRTAKLLKQIGRLLIIAGLALPLADSRTRQAISGFITGLVRSREVIAPGGGRGTPPEQTTINPGAPTLEQAKQVIPADLTHIYRALNDGNPTAGRGFISEQLLNSADKLDQICKPYTYRAHYIEAIVERPDDVFQVRVRVLFQPLEEHAQTMLFRIADGRSTLQQVQETGDDWFGPQQEEARDVVRRFLYAAKAGKDAIVAETTSSHLGLSPLPTDDEALRTHLSWLKQVDIPYTPSLTQYRGLKIMVRTEFPEPLSWTSTKEFFLDRIAGHLKIVRAFYDPMPSIWKGPKVYEDPDMDEYTLARFGLGAPLVKSPVDGTLKPEAPLLEAPLNPTLNPEASSTVASDPTTNANDGYHVDDVLISLVSGVSPPSALYKIEPEYSDEARRAHFSGVVSVSLLVGANGSPERIRVVQSPGLGLDAKVVEALQKWRFQPSLEDETGTPAKVRVEIDFTFRTQ